MTFHKTARVALALLLTMLFAVFGAMPAEARHHRRAGKHHHHRTTSVGRKKASRHGRGHHRGRRIRNRVRHAGRYLAAARRHQLHVGDVQHGKASWYGSAYHGRVTSSGEVFDKGALTAAHLSLPFGTRVRVRNLDNDSTVIVRITDRGPFGRGRILDVSEIAADQLGILARGVCHVSMEVLPAELPAPCFDPEDLPSLTPVALALIEPDHYYFLQVGAYANLEKARVAVQQLLLQNPSLPVIVSDDVQSGHVIHRVLAGRFSDRLEATIVSDRLKSVGLDADVREMILADS